jgi:hypothetical protein
MKPNRNSTGANRSRRNPLNLVRSATFTLTGCVLWLMFPAGLLAASRGTNGPSVILVVGAAGEAEYGSNFLRQTTQWQQACDKADCQPVIIGTDSSAQTNDLELLRRALDDEPKDGQKQLWLVLIGHGTFDGKESWFNLRGPDISAGVLARWIQPFHRSLAIINTAPCSGPFINQLSGTNRVIITATRAGNEQNFTRFGEYFADSLTNPEADLDHDGQVSVLEAFLTASRKTAEFYKVSGRILTEHALLDDNGDQLGTPPDWFHGLHAVKQAKDGAALDGLLALQFRLIPAPEDQGLSQEQLAQRDSLEQAIVLQREKKAQMSESDYYRDLEKLLVQLARWYADNTVPVTNGPRQNP